MKLFFIPWSIEYFLTLTNAKLLQFALTFSFKVNAVLQSHLGS